MHKIKQYLVLKPIDCAAYGIMGMVAIYVLVLMSNNGFWFADDSPSYMLLAQAFSPYFTAPDVILEGAQKENYPPLFPSLLAVLGASHSFIYAHLVVGLTFILGLPIVYKLAHRIIQDKKYALACILLYCLTPGVFLGILGILSEPLYIVLSLGFIALFLSSQNWHSDKKIILYLGLLSIACIMTRTIGICLSIAVFATILFDAKRLTLIRNKALIAAILAPGLVALLWHYFRPTTGASLYEDDVVSVWQSISSNPLDLIYPQLIGLAQAWHKTLHLYTTSYISPIYIASSLLALCFLWTLGKRLGENKLDAWYSAVYLLILLLWPFPEQLTRFLFPLMPMVWIYCLLFTREWLTHLANKPFAKYHFMVASLFFFALLLPSVLFLNIRVNDAIKMDKTRIVMSTHYNPNKERAYYGAFLNQLLFQDMKKIKTSVQKNETVLWFTPKYIYLLAERKSLKLPINQSKEKMLSYIARSDADYVYISQLNPWSSASKNPMFDLPYLNDVGSHVWNSQYEINDMEVMFSALVKINKNKLASYLKVSAN